MAGMLKTATNDAGAPKGAPAGKTSPEAIRAGLHLDAKQGAQLDRIVLAGKKVMFSKQSHQMMLKELEGPGTLAQKLGQGVAGLMALLWQESKQSLPPQLLIPAGMVLVAVAADFLRKGGMDVTDQDVAGGIEEYLLGELWAGIATEKIAARGRLHSADKSLTVFV